MPKMKRRTTTGKTIFREKKARVRHARCANCGRILHGVPRMDAEVTTNLSRTEKMPNRIFGGYYCSACTREILREKARKI